VVTVVGRAERRRAKKRYSKGEGRHRRLALRDEQPGRESLRSQVPHSDLPFTKEVDTFRRVSVACSGRA